MKKAIQATNMKLKKAWVGLSSLVIATMMFGTTAPIYAHNTGQDTDHKKHKQTPTKTKQKKTIIKSKQKQTTTQNNQNQRNNRNYVYNITYNFFGNDRAEQTNNNPQRTTTSQKQATPSRTSSKPTTHARPVSSHPMSQKQNRVYTETKWVYDPRLCRWVEIGYNKSTHRWELTYMNDRQDSRRDNPSDDKNYSYWYND